MICRPGDDVIFVGVPDPGTRPLEAGAIRACLGRISRITIHDGQHWILDPPIPVEIELPATRRSDACVVTADVHGATDDCLQPIRGRPELAEKESSLPERALG